MSDLPFIEGRAPFLVPTVSKPCATYYKVFGDLSGSAPPLIFLHGGPGCGHDYFLPFAELWPRYGIPVVLYDQIGCGKSTHIPETAGDKAVWNIDFFVNELDNLINHLGVRSGYHILGHSFGGMIAPEYAVRQPKGLKRLILASGIASKELSHQCFEILKSRATKAHQDAISEATRSGDWSTPEYKLVWDWFARNYLCRTENPPPEYWAGEKNITDDMTASKSMFGDSPWINGGNLVGWTSIPRLHNINVPTLVFNSEFDSSSQDIAQVPFFELIPRVCWYHFTNAGHMPWLESDSLRERVIDLIGGFLAPSAQEGSEGAGRVSES
ncbi:hypothetical protein ANO11243_055970 [Dothideomycetidae sp. 11243]|nr:hypothetical protein ANO11243_055970 [fungal sp. No.11243]